MIFLIEVFTALVVVVVVIIISKLPIENVRKTIFLVVWTVSRLAIVQETQILIVSPKKYVNVESRQEIIFKQEGPFYCLVSIELWKCMDQQWFTHH